MKMSLLLSLLFLGIVSNVVSERLSFDSGNYVVDWTHLPSTQEIEFNITAKAKGWVGLGISKENTAMKKLDIAIGGVKTGAGYLKDYYADGKGKPTEDTKQDVTPISSSETGDYTKIRFKRKLDTGEISQDNVIRVGDKYYIAWAYQSTDDSLSYHSKWGYSALVTLVAISPSPSVAPSSTVAVSTTSAPSSPAPSSTVAPTSMSVAPTTMPTTMPSADKQLTFKKGDYVVGWRYDSTAGEIIFKVTANGVGAWVGLGISDTNSGMKNMDVAVAMGDKVEDYFSDSKVTPVKDSKQDLTLIKSTLINGTTTVEFKRKLKTGDDKDLEIVVGKSYYIAWAYKKTAGSFEYHGQDTRGYSESKVVLAAEEKPTTKPNTEDKTTTKPSTGACALASIFVLVSSLIVSIIGR